MSSQQIMAPVVTHSVNWSSGSRKNRFMRYLAKRTFKPGLILMLYTAVLTISCALADETPDPAALDKQLLELENEINKFKKLLDESQGQKTDLEDNLEFNEKKINDLLRKIDNIEQDLHKGEARINRLIDQQEELRQAKSEQQVYIAKQVRAAHEIGQQEYLKLVLNQEDPNQLSRMLTYYDYFNHARAQQITTYEDTILQLDRITRLIENENSTLKSNRESLRQEEDQLRLAQLAKRRVLIALKQEIAATGEVLERKKQDRLQLEQLIESIRIGIVNLTSPADLVPFASLKGELLLPVIGKISHRYGNRRNEGKLKWSGVMIDAQEGDPVYAVHYGRVVFSDWLRGFGLLMIINHGEGYMSLYGHNQVLYRETGEWVTAGETIAAVGDSGGQNKSGLYFEIRVDGKTADPQLWCRIRTRRAA